MLASSKLSIKWHSTAVMTGKNVILLGSSHVHALMIGATQSAHFGRAVENTYSAKLLDEFIGRHNVVTPGPEPGQYSLRPDVSEWLETSLQADVVLLTISGSNWIAFCASNREPKLDIILPFAPELDDLPDAQVIPYSEMRRRMRENISNIILGIEAFRRHIPASVPVWYVEPPPPVEDNELIRQSPPFADEIARLGVSDPILRLKMYRLHSDIIAEACAASGVPFLPVPDENKTDQGFLLPECVGNSLHGNGLYGWRFVQEIERRLSTTEAA